MPFKVEGFLTRKLHEEDLKTFRGQLEGFSLGKPFKFGGREPPNFKGLIASSRMQPATRPCTAGWGGAKTENKNSPAFAKLLFKKQAKRRQNRSLLGDPL